MYVISVHHINRKEPQFDSVLPDDFQTPQPVCIEHRSKVGNEKCRHNNPCVTLFLNTSPPSLCIPKTFRFRQITLMVLPYRSISPAEAHSQSEMGYSSLCVARNTPPRKYCNTSHPPTYYSLNKDSSFV